MKHRINYVCVAKGNAKQTTRYKLKFEILTAVKLKNHLKLRIFNISKGSDFIKVKLQKQCTVRTLSFNS
jgi:hypothetical protein